MDPIALSVLFVLALIVLLRRPGVMSPALAGAEVAPHWPGSPAGDDDEQLPETDRAPRPWLPWGVAAVGLVRVALLVTLHA